MELEWRAHTQCEAVQQGTTTHSPEQLTQLSQMSMKVEAQNPEFYRCCTYVLSDEISLTMSMIEECENMHRQRERERERYWKKRRGERPREGEKCK